MSDKCIKWNEEAFTRMEEFDEHSDKDKHIEKPAASTRKVEIVLIDDNELFLDSTVIFFENRGKIVDGYYSPIRFLENISKYDKDTKICIDYDFGKHTINGIELAKQLHEKGYTKLYILTGNNLKDIEIPDYLIAFSKSEIDKLSKLLDVMQKNLQNAVF